MAETSYKKWILGLVLLLLVGGAVLVLTGLPRRGGEREPLVPAAPAEGFAAKERNLREQIRNSPERAELYASLGDLYFEQQDFARAADEYEEALKRNPQDADTYNDLGLALHYLGQEDKAVETLRKGTDADPSYQRIWLSLGYVLLSSGKTREARDALERAVELGPETTMGREARKFLQGLPPAQ
ncbi:MAG: tetratricopeptide repeat protein [Nitrospirota bacterium]